VLKPEPAKQVPKTPRKESLDRKVVEHKKSPAKVAPQTPVLKKREAKADRKQQEKDAKVSTKP
jgi:hypothetical protein